MAQRGRANGSLTNIEWCFGILAIRMSCIYLVNAMKDDCRFVQCYFCALWFFKYSSGLECAYKGSFINRLLLGNLTAINRWRNSFG
jgi:hypothetical protein